MIRFKINLRLIAVKFNRLTREECGPFPVFDGYILAFAWQLRIKARKNFIQDSRKVPVGYDSTCRQHSLLQVARTSCRSRSRFFREAGSMLGQRRYLPNCVTKGFHTSAKLESNLSEIWRGRQRKGLQNNREFACYQCNKGNSNNSKTLGLKHLPFPEMRAFGGTPYGAPLVHHRTDELLVEEDSIPNGDTTTPV